MRLPLPMALDHVNVYAIREKTEECDGWTLIDTLGSKLRHRLNGITAAKYPSGVRTAKITVKMPKEELSADFIDRTMLRTSKGK